MTTTPEVIAEVLREYKLTRSPFRTAKRVGVDISEVWNIIDANKDKLAAPQEHSGGQGREELREFIVGKRTVSTASWDNTEPLIAEARAAFEAGTHTLATGRDGSFLILYAIPLKKLAPKPDYFLAEQG